MAGLLRSCGQAAAVYCPTSEATGNSEVHSGVFALLVFGQLEFNTEAVLEAPWDPKRNGQDNDCIKAAPGRMQATVHGESQP